MKAINSSTSLTPQVERHFAGIEGMRLSAEKAAIGELREVHAAGYANFFGMAASHRFFHTPIDDMSSVSSEMQQPMLQAFASTLGEVAAAK